jgi:hypothetical protein
LSPKLEPHPQQPSPGRINLDHVAHFVPSREACRAGLEQLGFAPTAFSLQRHRAEPHAALAPVGTGNYCVMLRRGYLEFLVPLQDTEVANQLRRSIARYIGAHSIVFGTGDALHEHERLCREAFEVLPPIALERPIETVQGEGLARFTVVRVAAAAMEEGRIQFCQHHTEHLLWQERWLAHPNQALELAGVCVSVDSLEDVRVRYARFTAIALVPIVSGSLRLQTERGWIDFCEAGTLERTLGIRVRQAPVIAACVLATSDLAATRNVLACNGLEVRELTGNRIAVQAPAAVGGMFVFAAA